MANKKTPLIQQLRAKSGTVYVFPSASEDIGLNLDADVNGVALTHYALLNIPEIDRKKWLFGHTDVNQPEPGNLVVSKSLQNYMMNFETALINQENYNFQELSTVSERVFWHWFNKIGCIKDTNLKQINYNGKNYFYEQSVGERVVKCFGSIDAGNSLSAEFGVFNETYINIPSSYGSAPVFFIQKFDNSATTQNYVANSQIKCKSTALEGREDNISYISYTNNDDLPYGDNLNDNSEVVYNIGTSGFEAIEIVKDITTVQNLMRQLTGDKELQLYSFDEMNIDPNNKLSVENPDGTYKEFVANEFDFNAILLYYSVYDQNDVIKTAHATNLFGIVFLDGAIDTVNTADKGLSYIPSLTKKKSTPEGFGTGYSFRVNVRTMSIYDNSDSVIQDNTTLNSVISNDLSGAIGQLNRAIDILNTNNQVVTGIRDNYDNILNYYYSQRQDIQDISTLLNNYIKGKTTKLLDVDEIHTNAFYTNDDANQFDFYVQTGDNDEYNKPIYESILTISPDGLRTNKVNASDMYMQHGWYLTNKGFRDPAVLTDTDKIVNNAGVRSDIMSAQNVLDKMFDSSSNLVINIAEEHTGQMLLYDENYEKRYNKLYINEASNIFNANTPETVSWLKQNNTGTTIQNSTATIDYVGLIPYIIAQLQRISGRFNYSYDKNNTIYSQDDIKTLKDAVDYVFNMLNADDMRGYLGGIETSIYKVGAQITSSAIPLYKKGTLLELATEEGNPYFYKGQDVIVEFNWTAGEPNKNTLKRILLNGRKSTNLKDYVTASPNPEVVREVAVDSDTKQNFTILDNTVMILNPATDDMNEVEMYSGTYQVIKPDKDIHTSLTLQGAFTSAAFRDLIDKEFVSDVKCMVKCYYWVDYNNLSVADAVAKKIKVNTTNSTLDKIAENKTQLGKLKFFLMEDAVQQLNETFLNPEIDLNKGDAFVYFMLPYMNEAYTNIHVYADYDFGVGGYEIVNAGKPITVKEFDKSVEYIVYRTSQMQSYPINIKIG